MTAPDLTRYFLGSTRQPSHWVEMTKEDYLRAGVSASTMGEVRHDGSRPDGTVIELVHAAPPTTTETAWQHVDWTTVPMAEPHWRDLLLGILMDHQHKGDLDVWSVSLAETYGKTGTLEVTAGVLALRAEVSRLRGVLDTLRGRLQSEKTANLASAEESAMVGRESAEWRAAGRADGLSRAKAILAELYPHASQEGGES